MKTPSSHPLLALFAALVILAIPTLAAAEAPPESGGEEELIEDGVKTGFLGLGGTTQVERSARLLHVGD